MFKLQSLENWLKPRLAQVQEAGIPLNTGTISRMAKYIEERWFISLAYQKTKLLKQQLQQDRKLPTQVT
jgi:hypothetical protein